MQTSVRLSTSAAGQDAEAEQQRRHDHLQHGGVGKGGDDVGGEDVHQRVHEAGGLTGLKGDTGGVDDREEALEQVGQEHGQHDGPGSGAGIIHQRFDADGTHLADIAHGDDAGENGEKDDGHHHELQQVQENGAEGLDIADGKGGIPREGHADRDAQPQRQKDLEGKRNFFLLHIRAPLLGELLCRAIRRKDRPKWPKTNLVYQKNWDSTTLFCNRVPISAA